MLRNITLVAHRGYSSEAPENTISAFMLAIANGYLDIELDVQLTKDGVPIIIHDETLDRTTNGSGRVDEHTYVEIAKLDAGSWHSATFRDQRVPTLRETLIRLKGRANLHIELKSADEDLALRVAEQLSATGWIGGIGTKSPNRIINRPTIVISSFKRDQLLRSMAVMPTATVYELLVEEVTNESLMWAAKHNVRSYHPNGSDITPELVNYARSLNLHVGAWWRTRDSQDARAMARSGVRYAFVDSPSIHETKLKRNVVRLVAKLPALQARL